MKNIKSIEQFLFESKSSAKKRFLDRGLISNEVFDRFLEVDITPTKKFIEKMCEFFVGGSSEGEVIATFQKAISFSERQILSFDISLISSIQELQSLISEKENYQSRSERNFKAQKGAEVTYEDDRFLVLYITTKEASKKYGKGAKWCISAEKNNKWDDYTKGENGSEFYFVFDYKTTNKAWEKLAVEVNVKRRLVFLWNAYDNNKDYEGWWDDIIKFDYLESVGLPMSVFKYHDVETILFKSNLGIVGDYTINENGEVDVIGNVYLPKVQGGGISVKFGKVTGHFSCGGNKMRDLKNAPNWIGGEFNCSGCDLESLDGGPTYVGGDYICANNKLKDLVGAPITAGRDFDCSRNHLTTLKGCPKEVRNFEASYNYITSLEYSPEIVNGAFSIHANINLTNLKGTPKFIAYDYFCGACSLTSLEGVPEIINGNFSFHSNELQTLDYFPREVDGTVYWKGNPDITYEDVVAKLEKGVVYIERDDD
jgi:hypothetical protein